MSYINHKEKDKEDKVVSQQAFYFNSHKKEKDIKLNKNDKILLYDHFKLKSNEDVIDQFKKSLSTCMEKRGFAVRQSINVPRQGYKQLAYVCHRKAVKKPDQDVQSASSTLISFNCRKPLTIEILTYAATVLHPTCEFACFLKIGRFEEGLFWRNYALLYHFITELNKSSQDWKSVTGIKKAPALFQSQFIKLKEMLFPDLRTFKQEMKDKTQTEDTAKYVLKNKLLLLDLPCYKVVNTLSGSNSGCEYSLQPEGLIPKNEHNLTLKDISEAKRCGVLIDNQSQYLASSPLMVSSKYCFQAMFIGHRMDFEEHLKRRMLIFWRMCQWHLMITKRKLCYLVICSERSPGTIEIVHLFGISPNYTLQKFFREGLYKVYSLLLKFYPQVGLNIVSPKIDHSILWPRVLNLTVNTKANSVVPNSSPNAISFSTSNPKSETYGSQRYPEDYGRSKRNLPCASSIVLKYFQGRGILEVHNVNIDHCHTRSIPPTIQTPGFMEHANGNSTNDGVVVDVASSADADDDGENGKARPIVGGGEASDSSRISLVKAIMLEDRDVPLTDDYSIPIQTTQNILPKDDKGIEIHSFRHPSSSPFFKNYLDKMHQFSSAHLDDDHREILFREITRAFVETLRSSISPEKKSFENVATNLRDVYRRTLAPSIPTSYFPPKPSSSSTSHIQPVQPSLVSNKPASTSSSNATPGINKPKDRLPLPRLSARTSVTLPKRRSSAPSLSPKPFYTIKSSNNFTFQGPKSANKSNTRRSVGATVKLKKPLYFFATPSPTPMNTQASKVPPPPQGDNISNDNSPIRTEHNPQNILAPSLQNSNQPNTKKAENGENKAIDNAVAITRKTSTSSSPSNDSDTQSPTPSNESLKSDTKSIVPSNSQSLATERSPKSFSASSTSDKTLDEQTSDGVLSSPSQSAHAAIAQIIKSTDEDSAVVSRQSTPSKTPKSKFSVPDGTNSVLSSSSLEPSDIASAPYTTSTNSKQAAGKNSLSRPSTPETVTLSKTPNNKNIVAEKVKDDLLPASVPPFHGSNSPENISPDHTQKEVTIDKLSTQSTSVIDTPKKPPNSRNLVKKSTDDTLSISFSPVRVVNSSDLVSNNNYQKEKGKDDVLRQQITLMIDTPNKMPNNETDTILSNTNSKTNGSASGSKGRASNNKRSASEIGQAELIASKRCNAKVSGVFFL